MIFGRSVLLIAFFIVSSIPFLHAQEIKRNSFGVHYGFGSITQTSDVFGRIVFEPLIGSYYSDESYSGVVSLHYERQLTKRVAVGLEVAYETITKDILEGTFSYPNAYERRVATALVVGKYTYRRWSTLELYGRAGFGVTVFSDRLTSGQTEFDKSTEFALQLSPIGMIYGRNFYARVEAGFGWLGALSFGVGYQF